MALGDPAVNCDNLNVSLEQKLNNMLVKDSNGVVGLRTVITDETAADIVPVINCNIPIKSIEDILNQVIVLDGTGKFSLSLIRST